MKPKDIDCDSPFDGISYARVDEVSIVRLVEEKLEKFAQAMVKAGQMKGNVRQSEKDIK